MVSSLDAGILIQYIFTAIGALISTHLHSSHVGPPLTFASLSLAVFLLQLFREFLQTSLLHFLIAPDDTLLIFILLLFSQKSDCASFPV